jgi:hypothetical protein
MQPGIEIGRSVYYPEIRERLMTESFVESLDQVPSLAVFLFFAVAVFISLFVVGLPAVVFKTIAGASTDRTGLVGRSILWGAVVGTIMIAVQMAANYTAIGNPDWQGAIQSLGGLQWTAIGFVILAVMALALDYWKVLRPLQPRLPLIKVVVFLFFSNIWVVEGGWLLMTFNQMTLFPSCWDPAGKRTVNVILETRPEGCEDMND